MVYRDPWTESTLALLVTSAVGQVPGAEDRLALLEGPPHSKGRSPFLQQKPHSTDGETEAKRQAQGHRAQSSPVSSLW
jgi:hypothetical protein